MDKRRLQEIKERYKSPDDFELGYMNAFTIAVFKDIQELIAAYEQSRAESAEAFENWNNQAYDLRQKNTGLHIDVTDLRKQLAEVVAERGEIEADLIDALSLIAKGISSETNLIKQLAEAQAELDRIAKDSDNWAAIIEEPYG